MQYFKIIISNVVLFGLGLTALQSQTIKDIDGNVYKTVKIGTQTWMAENLKTTKFNDGTAIPMATLEANDWSNHTMAASTTPAFCWLYDSASVYKDSYGAFYNGFTVSSDNLCPTGWLVPSEEEWTILTNYLGGEGVAGGKLKEVGSKYWREPNNGATNSTGFAARAGGSISDNGSNWDLGDNAYFWSTTIYDETRLFTRAINFNVPDIYQYVQNKQIGIHVRCIKDLSSQEKEPVQDQINLKKQKLQEFETISNEQFRFEVTVPKPWSFSKIVQQDPYEEMKSGSYSSSISTGEDEKEPENWNGFKLISTDESNNPQPFLIIYGHKVTEVNPEEFATLFKRFTFHFEADELSANWEYSVGDAKGFDCTYGLGAKVRYTVLYHDGIRIVCMYYFPSSDPTLFEKYAPDVDKTIKSLIIK